MIDTVEQDLLPVEGHRRVDVVEGVLLQEDHVDEAAGLHRHEVVEADPLLARHLLHPRDLVAAREQRHERLHPVGPVAAQVLGGPGLELLAVARPGNQRVDGGVEALVGAIIGEPEEALHRGQRRLGDRLLEVAAGRRDRADDAERADGAIVGFHDAGALVDRLDGAVEIGGKRLLAGNLLEPPRGLAHRLCPARRGIGDHQGLQAHLPIVLADGDARVDGRFAGGDRHR